MYTNKADEKPINAYFNTSTFTGRFIVVATPLTKATTPTKAQLHNNRNQSQLIWNYKTK